MGTYATHVAYTEYPSNAIHTLSAKNTAHTHTHTLKTLTTLYTSITLR